MPYNSILVAPDGYIYNGGRGIEDSFVRGYPYADKPILGQYIHGQAANTPKDPMRALRYESVVKETMLGASAKETMNMVLHSHPHAVSQMLKAAPAGVTNSDNIEHLQLIRLHPELQAMPITYFWLESVFVVRQIPHLEYREPFRDVVDGPQYLGRLEQAPATDLKYDEISYSLNKLVDKVYVPFEDIYRTIINPMQADIENVRWAFQRKRNISAREAIMQVANAQGQGSAGTDNLTKFELFGSDSPYHSKGHASKELMDLFGVFVDANDINITDVIMHPRLFAEYTENTWTRTGPNQIMPERLTIGGIRPMPGLDGITATTDLSIPHNTIYAINKPNALRLGEGPKILRRYEDNERDAVAIKILDFHQHLAVNAQISKIDRKFGMTITVD